MTQVLDVTKSLETPLTVFRFFVFAFFASLLPAYAQDVRWEMIDSGVLNHSTHGRGIEIRIEPEPFPVGLFENEDLDKLLLSLCNYYAPHVVPFVMQKADIETPDFVAVRIVSGGMFGQFVLQAYAISVDKCGDEL